MQKSDICFEYLTESIFHEHEKQINAFDCSKDGYHEGLNQRLRESLASNVTTLVFFDFASERKIIAYCAFCCSSLKDNGEQIPAVEIVNFAVDKAYQDLFFTEYSHNEKRMPCSAFVFGICLDLIDETCRGKMYAKYVFLQSQRRNRTLDFYKRHHFDVCPPLIFLFREKDEYTVLRAIPRR